MPCNERGFLKERAEGLLRWLRICESDEGLFKCLCEELGGVFECGGGDGGDSGDGGGVPSLELLPVKRKVVVGGSGGEGKEEEEEEPIVRFLTEDGRLEERKNEVLSEIL